MAGGPALYLGANLQATFAAWCGVLAMAEERSQLLEISDHIIERVGQEQNWPLDDNALWFADDVRAFVQVKETLSVSAGEKTEYAKVWAQVVAQFLHGRGREAQTAALRDEDRFLVVVGQGTAKTIRDDLRNALLRLASHPSGDSLMSAAQGQAKIKTQLQCAADHVSRLLKAHGKRSSEDDVRKILSHCRVFEVTQKQLRASARQFLSTLILADGQSATAAMEVLENLFSDAGETRRSYDVTALRRHLIRRFVLRAPRAVAGDVEILLKATDRFIKRETRSIRAPEGEITVPRNIADAIVATARQQNVAITSQGGGGKSGAVAQVARSLRDAGETVVVFDADAVDAADVGRSLHLQNRFEDVLERWPDEGIVAFLLVDGFDALRIGCNAHRLLTLIEDLRVVAPRWRVVAASREYDLETLPQAARAFPTGEIEAIRPEDRDEVRFQHLSHIVVRGFSDAELELIGQRSLALKAVFMSADASLRALLRNPFNLSIAADVIGQGAGLSTVRDRIGLLDLWWQHRVAVGDRFGRESALRAVVEGMIARRRLRLPAAHLATASSLAQLLSDGVLSTLGPRSGDVAFPHSLLFDYTAYRTVLADVASVSTLLRGDRDAFVFLWTGLRFRLDSLWNEQRDDFFELVAEIFTDGGSQRLALLMLISRVIVEKATIIDDLRPILQLSNIPVVRIVRFVVRSLIRSRQLGESYLHERSEMWGRFALQLATGATELQHDASLVLAELTEHVPSSRTNGDVVLAARTILARELGAAP